MFNMSESWLGAALSVAAAANESGESGTNTTSDSLLGDPLFLIVGLVFIFYFMVLRPQKKDKQKAKDMLDNIQKGDRVVTIGGIHGKIAGLDENRNVISLEVASKVVIKMSRDSVRTVEKKSTGPDKADKEQKK